MNWLNAYGDNTRLNAYNARYLTQKEGVKELVEPSLFQGFGDAATKALPASFLESSSSGHDFSAFILDQKRETEDAFDPNDYSDAQERAAQLERYNARVDRRKIEQDYTPNPDTTGEAAQLIYGLLRFVPKAAVYSAGGAAGMAALGADVGVYEAGKLKDKGVRADVANVAGLITGVTAGVGAGLPSHLGKSYVKSIAYGALSNPALDITERGAIQSLLKQYQYDDVAAEYDPFDATSITTSAVMGAAFGYIGARSVRGSKLEDAKAVVQNIDEKTGISDKSKAAVESVGNKTKQAVNTIKESDFGRTVDAITEPAQEKVTKVSRDAVDAAMELKSAMVHQRDQLVGEKGSVTRSLEQEKVAREQLDNGNRASVSDSEIDYGVLYDNVNEIHAALNVEVGKSIGNYSLDPVTGELKPSVDIQVSVKHEMADVPKVKEGKKLTRKQRKAEKMRQRQAEAGKAKQEASAVEKNEGVDESVELSVKEFNEEVKQVREQLEEPLSPEEMADIQAEFEEKNGLSVERQKRVDSLRRYAPELPETRTLEPEVVPEQIRAEADTPEVARAEVTPEEVRADEIVAEKEAVVESKPEEAKAEAKPEEATVVREAEVETPEPVLAPQEDTRTVGQILNGLIDETPLPDDTKAVVKEAVGKQLDMFEEAEIARKAADEPVAEPPAEHPRKGVFTPEQALDNRVNKVIEENPDMYIVDENGNQRSLSEFIEEVEIEAKNEVELAQAFSEGASCMFQQGALDLD